MRILGIDPSSSICGVALIDTPDSVRAISHWERDKSRSHPQGFKDYFYWLNQKLYSWKPNMAVIEMAAFSSGGKGNHQAAQAVAFYQAISALTCKINGLVVIESRVTTARRVVLGNGAISKDEAWDVMRKRYPDRFSPKTRGGLDEMDALTHALSGPDVAER